MALCPGYLISSYFIPKDVQPHSGLHVLFDILHKVNCYGVLLDVAIIDNSIFEGVFLLLGRKGLGRIVFPELPLVMAFA